MPDPLPIIPGFSLVAGPFQSQWGTLYGMYEGTGDIPATLPDPYEYWLAGKNAAGNNALIIRPRKASPAPPPLPPLTVKVADVNDPNRGHGIELSDAAPALRDHWVEGYAQNVVAKGLTVPFLIERVTATKAWRDNPGDRYQGQGFFIQNCPAGGTIRECVAAWNGWQPGRPANRRSGFLHGLYAYWDVGPIDIEWSIFANNPCAGVQFKNCGTISDTLIFDCAMGVLSLRGPTKLRRVLIVDGHRYAISDGEGKVTSWTGDTAVSAYGPIDVDEVYAYGGPRQRMPDVQPMPARSYNMRAFEGSKDYEARPKISDGKPEWGVKKGQPDPGAPQGAQWTVGPKVYANDWMGGAAGGSAAPTGVQAGPPLPDGAYARIEQLVQEATTPGGRRPKDIIAEAFAVAGLSA